MAAGGGKKSEAKSKPQPKIKIQEGGLTSSEIETLFDVLPWDGWALIHNMFHAEGTAFPAPACANAARVQAFTKALTSTERFKATQRAAIEAEQPKQK